MTTKKIEPIVDIDLDALIEQKAEARGDDGRSVSFTFKGQRWTFLDPLMLTDEEKDELGEIDYDPDVAAWYMGGDQYDRFLEVGGNSSMFFQAFGAYQRKAIAENQGNPTRSNRSSRRRQKR